MHEPRPRALIIGGSGVFGAHLCRRLARLKQYEILVGGRSAKRADPLCRELLALDEACAARFVAVDRLEITTSDLKRLGIKVVVDAAGPFQGSPYSLADAAIEARVHYIDLSDARDFVSGIKAYEVVAKTTGVAVLTGASSTPALSNAILRDLVKGWQSIDRIHVSIVPGNKAPRGRSVMQAILTWVGAPVRVFDDGSWQHQPGWSGQKGISLGGDGVRYSSLADTPDLDVLVEDFKPRVSARFHAGLELAVMHRGLQVMGWLRRWKLLPNLAALTAPLFYAATLLGRLGTDIGGMVVEAIGIDGDGRAVRANAKLLAHQGDGPIIPSLAAVALLKRIADHELNFSGASHAGHHIGMREVLALIPDLAIRLETSVEPFGMPLFQRVLGASFDAMPSTTQLLHRGSPAVMGEGQADISKPDSVLGQLISALFRFPKPGKAVPVSVLVERDETGERWVRRYPGRTMASRMSNDDPDGQTLEETFGPLSFRMKITGHKDGLDMKMQGARIGRLPLPRFLVPMVAATERVDVAGRHLFDVSIDLPVIGQIVHYRGWLSLR
jgi:NAD(P)-dependent dehydrogenase (short-subunit alcohol dehydrogenase family)